MISRDQFLALRPCKDAVVLPGGERLEVISNISTVGIPTDAPGPREIGLRWPDGHYAEYGWSDAEKAIMDEDYGRELSLNDPAAEVVAI